MQGLWDKWGNFSFVLNGKNYLWNNGINEAKTRLTEVVETVPIKFDSRDRSALAYVLKYLQEKEKLSD